MIDSKQIKQIKKLSERNGRVITKVSRDAGQRFINNPQTKLTKTLKSGCRYNVFDEAGKVKMFEMIYLEETKEYFVCVN
jgi:hypothetical protein